MGSFDFVGQLFMQEYQCFAVNFFRVMLPRDDTGKKKVMTCRRCFLLLLCLLILPGCGSEKVSGARTTPVKLSIAWGERSRAVNAPSSALSAVVTLVNANPAGGDFLYSINRDAAPQTYTGNYTSPNTAKTGSAALSIRFYAQANGMGIIVGAAQAQVTINGDGTGIGNVSTTNAVASVALDAGQTIRMGQVKDLAFSAKDAQGGMVAVTPGSAQFTVATGNDKLQIVNGQAKGIAVGTASVGVTLDGKTGANTDVTVTALTPAGYTVTDLGMPPGGVSAYPVSINSQGTIVGYYSASTQGTRGFIWRNGVITDLGIAASGNVIPAQINDAEQVTGTMGARSFLWSNGLTIDLGLLGGGNQITARGLNNRGVIVGNAQTANGEDHAFMWQVGKLTDLGSFTANAINDSGMITGEAGGIPFQKTGHAILWQNGALTDPGIGDDSVGYAINAAGHIAGTLDSFSAFFWKDGTTTPLRSAPKGSALPRTAVYPFKRAYGINDLDQVVGGAGTTPSFSGAYALLYSEGQIFRLNIPNNGPNLVTARGINNNGWIVGEGSPDGHTHAFLLTPQ